MCPCTRQTHANSGLDIGGPELYYPLQKPTRKFKSCAQSCAHYAHTAQHIMRFRVSSARPQVWGHPITSYTILGVPPVPAEIGRDRAVRRAPSQDDRTGGAPM